MSENKFDICVIGAGPGGYVAAIKAAKLGAKTVLIEKELLGGTCLNTGCIPTKTLIAGAEVLRSTKHAEQFGVDIAGDITINWQRMLQRKDDTVSRLRQGVKGLLQASGVSVIRGSASFTDKKTITVVSSDGESIVIEAANSIIATGSEALVPSFLPKSNRILTSTELLSIADIPESLTVLGGGVIGCEFASLFAELGTKVTIVEMAPSILPEFDRELVRVLALQMKKRGVTIITGAALEDVKLKNNGVVGRVGNEEVTAEYMLVATGRKSVNNTLNLEATKVETDDNNWIVVNSQCRTNIPEIYAIGDTTGRWQLAHAASSMGVVAASNICGKTCEFKSDLIPGCVFTAPEVATVGLSQEQCKARNIDINVGKFPFAALGKALAVGEPDGMCKIIADATTDKILGVHIAGAHATDLISEAVVAMNAGTTAQQLGEAIHPHPTFGEVIMESAHAVHGQSIHIRTPVSRNRR